MCWLIVYVVYRSTKPKQCLRAWTQHQPRCHHTSTRELGDRLAQLLELSLSKTSLTMYHRLWQILQQFIRDGLGLQIQLYPLSTHTLALFIAFLAEKNYAAFTVSSYISALSFPHR